MGRSALVLAVVAAGLYGAASLPNALIYDDLLLIAREVRPQQAGDLLRVFAEPHYEALQYYRPVVRITYLAQKALHGDAPAPFHVFNAALIALLLPLAYGLLRAPALRIRPLPALLAATAFVLHPVASSCVHPVAGRETTLPTAFLLLSVLAWLKDGPWWRATAAAAFALALFGKEQMIVVPLLFLLADLVGVARRPTTPRGWLIRYLPAAVVLAGYALLRSRLITSAPEIALWEDPLGPVASLAYGLQSLVFPTARLVYEPSVEAWFSLPRFLVALGCAAVLALAAWRLRATLREPLLFWTGWFLAGQLPTANIFHQEVSFDERYLFLPSLGLFALAATVASAEWRSRRGAVAAAAAAAVVLAVLGGISLRRSADFADSRSFYGRWLATNPRSANANNGMGGVLALDGRLEEALERYDEALRLKPDHEQARNNAGVALSLLGRHEQALERFREAIQLRPGYADAHYNMANTLVALGDLHAADERFREAIRLRPANPSALNNYGGLLVRQGRIDEAMEMFAAVIRLEPGHAPALLNNGILLARQGRYDDAISHYRQALRLSPDSADAHFDLAQALARTGAAEEALWSYRRALSLRPDWPVALNGLARLLATHADDGVRDGPRAVKLARRACEMTGHQSAELLDTLAAAHAEAGRFGLAVEWGSRAADLARSQENEALAVAIETRLAGYRRGETYRN